MSEKDFLDELYELIKSRKDGDPETSWTARLLAEAPDLPTQKLSEEVAELVAEALKGNKVAMTAEAADVLYHFLVLLVASEVRLEDVLAELKARRKQSGIAEKASRSL